MSVEPERIAKLNTKPDRPDRRYVLYWAQMNRRVDANHGLLYATQLANGWNLPVVFYEGVRYAYPYANDRLQTFLLQAVPETAKRLKAAGIGYVFYLRKDKNSRTDVLATLAKDAAALVTDDYPTFIARDHNAKIPQQLDVSYYVVDSSCVIPMSQIEKRQYAAYTMRPRVKRLLPKYFHPPDELSPKRRFDSTIPSFHIDVTEQNIPALVAACDIDHSVPPSLSFKGGRLQAEKLLDYFLQNNLSHYARDRNEPSLHATSHMSPYLHFGQMSSLEIALAVRDYAQKNKLSSDEYLEELIVRRELAFNYARFVEDPESFGNLPQWCQENMQNHASDQREPSYTAQQLERAETYDQLWNATQKEMLLRGKIHGYYRMYWGKKIIEWSRTYEEALRYMVDMHGRYALDGRDANTYTNILWCFGLHDRPWFERPIFGKMRYMSLEGMKRKTNIQAYINEIELMERTGKDEQKAV